MRQLFAIILFFASLCQAYADVVISSDTLSVGDMSYQKTGFVNVRGYNTIFWKPNPNCWLKFDLTTPGKARISGSNEAVHFYDHDINSYIPLLVQGNNHEQLKPLNASVSPLAFSDYTSLMPVTFKWKDAKTESESAIESESDTHYGFIAQQLQQYLPQLVKEDGRGNLLVNYEALIPVLIGYIQSLDAEVEAQSVELDLLLEQLDHYDQSKL